MKRYTSGFRRRAVADLARPPSLIAGEHERLVAMVTGDNHLAETMIAHVHVARHPRRVGAAEHCDNTQQSELLLLLLLSQIVHEIYKIKK